MTLTFDTLNLNTPLKNALSDLGFEHPTPIQQKAFSVIMSGRDVVGIAQTGTGKTLAYLLPILRQLTFSKQKAPRVLIVAPTRELVVQLVGEIEKLTAYMTVRVEGVFGGTNINTQKQRIEEGVDVMVATPGRLIDLALTRVLKLNSIKQLVIDEVDEMLSLGFLPQLEQLLDLLPPKRQNLLFSATMTEEVEALIDEFFNAPQYVEIVKAGTPIEKIRQSAYEVPNFFTKINLLANLLANDPEMSRVLIFSPTKRIADVVHERLQDQFPDQMAVVHSNKSQNFRLNSVVAFQKGELRGLITTDLLSRGLDVTDVTHVVNINTPDVPELYIHRIGRTGRADTEGASITFIAPAEKEYQAAIEEFMGKEIPMQPLPESLEVSKELTLEEQYTHPEKNYLPRPTLKHSQGAFHEKKEKNKKVNKGLKSRWMREKKYKKPLKKKSKR
ncbi:MAG: DEAD/DEAH box helicase [Saprospiraceae bacterium]|nr:DEAD/DEAH box helicase [Saprospiraceae bacterium]MCB9345073.1 DEAD/DEAH box helicase [Lewinellaceae bacterium]